MKVRPKKKNKTKAIKNDPKANEIAYLRILLAHSLKHVEGKSEGLDSLFQNQANRIAIKLGKLEQ